MTKIRLIVVILVALIFAINTFDSVSACTVFTASQGDVILAGNNEDWLPTDTFVRFHPGVMGHFYGAITFGFEDELWLQGGMNEMGLFFDITALPPTDVQAHPERMVWNEDINVKVLKECSKVEEVIQLYNTTFFSGTWGGQLLFADKFGDAVVIGMDANGELKFTRKEGDYLVMTNFNLANPANGYYPSDRYDIATQMLENMDNITVDNFQRILSATHQESMDQTGSVTIYSNIYDLTNGIIYVYRFHHFEEVVTLNVTEELAKGQRTIPLSELFVDEIYVENAYNGEKEVFLLIYFQEVHYVALYLVMVVCTLICAILCISLIVRMILRRLRKGSAT